MRADVAFSRQYADFGVLPCHEKPAAIFSPPCRFLLLPRWQRSTRSHQPAEAPRYGAAVASHDAPPLRKRPAPPRKVPRNARYAIVAFAMVTMFENETTLLRGTRLPFMHQPANARTKITVHGSMRACCGRRAAPFPFRPRHAEALPRYHSTTRHAP